MGAAINIAALMVANLAGFVLGLDGLKGNHGCQTVAARPGREGGEGPHAQKFNTPVFVCRDNPANACAPPCCGGNICHFLFCCKHYVLASRLPASFMWMRSASERGTHDIKSWHCLLWPQSVAGAVNQLELVVLHNTHLLQRNKRMASCAARNNGQLLCWATEHTLQPGICSCTWRNSTAPCSRCSRDSGTYGRRKMGFTRPHIASAVLLRHGGCCQTENFPRGAMHHAQQKNTALAAAPNSQRNRVGLTEEPRNQIMQTGRHVVVPLQSGWLAWLHHSMATACNTCHGQYTSLACCMRLANSPGMMLLVTLITPCIRHIGKEESLGSTSSPLAPLTSPVQAPPVHDAGDAQRGPHHRCRSSRPRRCCGSDQSVGCLQQCVGCNQSLGSVSGVPVFWQCVGCNQNTGQYHTISLFYLHRASPVHSFTPTKFSCDAMDMMTSSWMSCPASQNVCGQHSDWSLLLPLCKPTALRRSACPLGHACTRTCPAGHIVNDGRTFCNHCPAARALWME